MTFDFNFDLSVLEQADTVGQATSAEEQATLALLKRFIQNYDNPQIAQWQCLQQQLVRDFLPHVALFDVDDWSSYQKNIETAMLEIKQQLLCSDPKPKTHLKLQHSLSTAVWQELLQKIKISEHLVGADVDGVQHLATLCASLPCQVGYAEGYSIAAINCFDMRTELQVDDLMHMAAMLNGTEEIKLDLAQLITLDIRSPTWSWPDVILRCESATATRSELSFKNLKKQLSAQHLITANDPATDLLALFALAQQVGQQKIQHTRQLLSSLTHVLLDEDALSNQLQQSAQELQKMLRQQVTALQNNAEQMNKCLELFEADLQKLLPHYVKDNNLLQAKTDDFISQSNKAQKVGTLEWLHSAAEQGNSDAQFNLGDMYEEGRGVAQNNQEAVRWYRKAAEQGHSDAQFNLGWMYQKGRGVTQNYQEAVGWYRKAAEQGKATAQYFLGSSYQQGRGVAQNDQEAVSWYRKAAEQGNATAQYFLGDMYEEGRGVAQNNQEAVRWYRKAAEQGNATAQYFLGSSYQQGRGVAQNDQEAANWYRKAAEQGDADAQFHLGLMYEEGRGVTKNSQEAVSWYRKAAEHNHAQAAACVANTNKVWYDSSTNLTWMRCSLGQIWDGITCVGTAKKYTWDQARQAVAEMNRNGGYAGYTDWVLPDLKALKSLLRDHKNPPKIDHTTFPNTPADFYWSASPDTDSNRAAWYMSFSLGVAGVSYKSGNGHVRAVRAGR